MRLCVRPAHAVHGRWGCAWGCGTSRVADSLWRSPATSPRTSRRSKRRGPPHCTQPHTHTLAPLSRVRARACNTEHAPPPLAPALPTVCTTRTPPVHLLCISCASPVPHLPCPTSRGRSRGGRWRSRMPSWPRAVRWRRGWARGPPWSWEPTSTRSPAAASTNSSPTPPSPPRTRICSTGGGGGGRMMSACRASVSSAAAAPTFAYPRHSPPFTPPCSVRQAAAPPPAPLPACPPLRVCARPCRAVPPGSRARHAHVA